jgi:glycosyltransferase involved in cell wall biosynthesis
MMDPVVSVVIPTYNRLPQLQEAVSSVKAQSYENYEIIVADDGSSDGTAQWLEKQDVRFVLLAHTSFPGLVRNRGVESARGKYVCFLDSDDVWKEQKLEKQVAYFKNNSEAVICHTREVWLRKGNIISQSGQKHRRAGYIFPDALKKCIIGPSTVMMERKAFLECGTFCENLEIAEDYELWLRVTSVHEVGYIDEPLVEKRAGHPEQLSKKYGHIELFRIWALLLNIGRGRFTHEQLALTCRELERKCRIYAFGCQKRGKRYEALFYSDLAAQAEVYTV